MIDGDGLASGDGNVVGFVGEVGVRLGAALACIWAAVGGTYDSTDELHSLFLLAGRGSERLSRVATYNLRHGERVGRVGVQYIGDLENSDVCGGWVGDDGGQNDVVHRAHAGRNGLDGDSQVAISKSQGKGGEAEED